MSIDIDAIKGRIANGIYGDDRLTGTEIFDALAALDELVAEVERLRAEADEMRRWAEEAAHAENINAQDAQKERAAVVAWLREGALGTEVTQHESYGHAFADGIERGEHRREGET